MEPLITGKPSSSLRNLLVRMLLIGLSILVIRFAYVVTITGGACGVNSDGFCFFSENRNVIDAGVRTGASTGSVAHVGSSSSSTTSDLWTSKEWRKKVDYYSFLFQDLINEGFLSSNSKALCVETLEGQDVFALQEIGVSDSIGISRKASLPLVRAGQAFRQPFDDNSFDFVFSGAGGIDRSMFPMEFGLEMGRTVKPEGFVVVHTASAKDMYSFNSFLGMFNCCSLVRTRDIEGPDSSSIREIVLKKVVEIPVDCEENSDGISSEEEKKCNVPGYKHEIIRNAEPLIIEEPLKPWLTLKRNIKNIKYLPHMVDISFKRKYVYVDVGARYYGSSIGSWFKKQYPKLNKTFDIYAIEADKTFHQEYKFKKGIKLLPYAAWVRNESLFFEINGDPGQKVDDNKRRGMGRIRPVQSSENEVGDVDKIQGFDFANWLKNTVKESDFVVMKMDVEGTEFDLIPRLFETGAICLIDEIFLECHYNRWQRCCPGERSAKYEKTYGQCLDLFKSLRDSGVLVHQWW